MLVGLVCVACVDVSHFDSLHHSFCSIASHPLVYLLQHSRIGEFPTTLGRLTKLMRLSLEYNEFTGALA